MKNPKKRYLIANWKMNPASTRDAEKLFNEIEEKLKSTKNTEIVICPPFLYIPRLKTLSSKITLGAQNSFWEKEGPYTGEISPLMLKNLGCLYVILGHSERRRYFKETEKIIEKKVNSALKEGLIPVICVGETNDERKKQETKKTLGKQLSAALKNLQFISSPSDLILAYEPRWAIGSGETPKPAEAGEIAKFIKKKVGEEHPVLYGGSVSSQNVSSYLREGFNGVLVGGASLESEEFTRITQIIEEE